MTRVKMHSSTFFNILLAKFGQLHLELYAIKGSYWVSNNKLHTCPPLGQLFNRPHFLNKDLTLGTNQQPCRRHHGFYHNGKSMTSQHHQKSHLMHRLNPQTCHRNHPVVEYILKNYTSVVQNGQEKMRQFVCWSVSSILHRRQVPFHSS